MWREDRQYIEVRGMGETETGSGQMKARKTMPKKAGGGRERKARGSRGYQIRGE